MNIEHIIFVLGLSAFPLLQCYKEFLIGPMGIVWATITLTLLLVALVPIIAGSEGVPWEAWVYLVCLVISAVRAFIMKDDSAPSVSFEKKLLLVGGLAFVLTGLLLFFATQRYVFIEDHTLDRIVTFDRLTGLRK